ncbi:MAG: ABC transporter permease [Deltaproteobacteria bacterium]|nr:ABC transporter permease [Deltaproteobacteria bacterium]
MRAVRAIARREFAAYFGSPTAYVLLAVYLTLSGYFFYSDVAFFVTFGAQVLETGLWRYVFIDFRLVTLLVLPLVTMRLFAEERKLGTIELLWTLPVRDYQLILGKFLAAWGFFLVTLVLAMIPFAVFYVYHPFALGPPTAGFLGLLLLGTAFIACGLAASTLTENQVVAAMVTYGILVFFWFMTWNEAVGSEWIVRVLLLLSLFDHYYSFATGSIQTADLAYFALFTLFFLYAGLRSLQSRAWRGVV